MVSNTKIKLIDRFTNFIFNRICLLNRYNENGCGSGWWQLLNFDYKAYEFIKRTFPTKTYWLTARIYNIKFENKLTDFDDLRWGASDISVKYTRDGRRIIRFKSTLWQETKLVSSAYFLFIESR